MQCIIKSLQKIDVFFQILHQNYTQNNASYLDVQKDQAKRLVHVIHFAYASIQLLSEVRRFFFQPSQIQSIVGVNVAQQFSPFCFQQLNIEEIKGNLLVSSEKVVNAWLLLGFLFSSCKLFF